MENNTSGVPTTLGINFDFISHIPAKLQNCIKVNFKNFLRNDCNILPSKSLTVSKETSDTEYETSLDKQIQAWKSNPTWSDEPPEIKVSVPKGSLCNLNVKFKAGLPPDAIYNIIINPENKRVFKNIKEVISRRVLIDEGSRQVVEVEQAAIWRFLWWSGTISVHVFVDQDRKNHTVRFKQGRTGFMERFEGCWKIEPLYIDNPVSFSQSAPRTLAEYEKQTTGKGRVGSSVSLEQLIQPALVPPPPISWYLRGITTKTTEMLIQDLLAETARLRETKDDQIGRMIRNCSTNCGHNDGRGATNFGGNDIKERWRSRRKGWHGRRRSM
ncbi:hypothetical protein LUZ62_018455 [Rhynchospora pubera]|uniref:DUF220 domain-containing protein n=1 Tax=Rhynchospora pubera TaxID=906938 RepID=A0AAV8GMV3_9POAL|nr:hypothetical protein LUZ62_018196 [Rhynchospora pubera]KAJ4805889.1 hypothetical protein LUZ62_018455 [Rhynchospora pubera]